MAFCEHCGEEIGYLPFKCKYCGGTFCKKHRLPENHDCTFELKHTPITPTERVLYQDTGRPSYQDGDYKRKKEIKRYMRQQQRQRSPAYRGGYGRSTFSAQEAKGTTYIIITIIICSILGVFLPAFINLSLYGLSEFYLWILFTSLFSNGTDIFGLFFLLIMVFIFFNFSQNLEKSFGTEFFVKLYLFCAALTGLFYIVLRLMLAPFYPANYATAEVFSVGLASGAIFGIIAFTIFPNPDREMTILCYFIPVKMKGRVLLIILVLFRLIPGLLYGLLFSPLYFPLYFSELGGILAAYIVFKKKSRNSPRF